jgi:hypothetical protein
MQIIRELNVLMSHVLIDLVSGNQKARSAKGRKREFSLVIHISKQLGAAMQVKSNCLERHCSNRL